MMSAQMPFMVSASNHLDHNIRKNNRVAVSMSRNIRLSDVGSRSTLCVEYRILDAPRPGYAAEQRVAAFHAECGTRGALAVRYFRT